jgi:hypothetical protein
MVAIGSASMTPISRRRLLRAALIGLPAVALASSAGFGVVANRVGADEIVGYDKVDGLLERIGDAAANSPVSNGVAGTQVDPGGES